MQYALIPSFVLLQPLGCLFTMTRPSMCTAGRWAVDTGHAHITLLRQADTGRADAHADAQIDPTFYVDSIFGGISARTSLLMA